MDIHSHGILRTVTGIIFFGQVYFFNSSLLSIPIGTTPGFFPFRCRITPNEWQNPHPCNPQPEEMENSLSLLNCLWFSMGSILCQGSDILPR